MQSLLMPLFLLLLGMAVVLFLWFFPAWQIYRTQGLDKTKAETCLGLINDSPARPGRRCLREPFFS